MDTRAQLFAEIHGFRRSGSGGSPASSSSSSSSSTSAASPTAADSVSTPLRPAFTPARHRIFPTMPNEVLLMTGTVGSSFSIGADAWGNTGLTTITSHAPLHAFQDPPAMVPFVSGEGYKVCLMLIFKDAVSIDHIDVCGGAFTQAHKLRLLDHKQALLGEQAVSGVGNNFLQSTIQLRHKPLGKTFYLEEECGFAANYQIARRYQIFCRDIDAETVPPPKLTLLEDIKALFNNEELSDLSFVVEGRKIFVTRAIVAVRCPPLRAMLYGPMKEGKLSTIEIPTAKYDPFFHFLHFLYTDSLAPLITDPQLYFEILWLAEQYMLESLKILCCHKIKDIIQMDNVTSILMLAAQHNAAKLKELCVAYIATHADVVCKSEDFLNLKENPDLLMEITLQLCSRQ